jgi:hypothetical protein
MSPPSDPFASEVASSAFRPSSHAKNKLARHLQTIKPVFMA